LKTGCSPLLWAVLLAGLAASCGQKTDETNSAEVAKATASSRAKAQESLPRFSDFPAGEKFAGTPAAPVFTGAEARRYRTVIQRQAAAGPNFAGHFTVATWGCGSTCIGFAVVDARTGEIHFHPTVRRAMQVPYQTDSVLQYRPDSRLLVIAGETEGPAEQSSSGKFYYEWKDGRFSLLAKAEIQLEPGAPPLPSGMTLDDLCSGIENSLECAREIERYQLRKQENTARVKRAGARLELRLADGRWLEISDAQKPGDETSVIQFNFREFLPEIDCYLLHRQHYEGADYLLIHARAGSRYELHDVPVVSPDRQRLATASDGVAGGYNPNAVQIWRLTKDGLELEQTLELEELGPSNPQWIDNRTIRLTLRDIPDARGQRRTSSAILKRNGEWRFEQSAPPSRD